MSAAVPAPLETVVAVPPTPFLDDGRLDHSGFERVLRRVVDGGITAVTIAGNTGEFWALSAAELAELVDVAGSTLAGRAALLVGIGGDLSTARQAALRAASAGAYGVMIHEPAGPFRSADGWVRYHADLAAAVPSLAVVPYVRDATVCADELRALVTAAPNTVAVKYAVPDPVRLAEIVAACPSVHWICGLAELWAPSFWPAGATGFTSGLAVIEPRLSLALHDHLRNGRPAEARATCALVRPYEALRSRDRGAANVPAIKEALAQLGVAGRTVRPPLSELVAGDRAEVERILASWDRAAAGVVA